MAHPVIKPKVRISTISHHYLNVWIHKVSQSVDVFPGYSINFFYRFQVLNQGEWTQTWLQLLPSTKPSFPT